jgi:hypothetical protein
VEAAVALPVLLAATGLLLALVEWGVWTWTLNSAADAGAQALASGQSPAVAQVASVAAVRSKARAHESRDRHKRPPAMANNIRPATAWGTPCKTRAVRRRERSGP